MNTDEHRFKTDLSRRSQATRKLKAPSGPEWLQQAKSLEDWSRLVKGYHARRIAYFVLHEWNDPIVLNTEGGLTDGLHRIKAARHKGMDEVEIVIAK